LNPINGGQDNSGGESSTRGQLSPELQQWENYQPLGLTVGATIGGVYTIIELIGRGGMGEVYLVRHDTLNKKCALKVIPPNKVTDVGWKRFQLEARAVAKLEHVNLVKVTDLGIHDGSMPYYAMDYIQGRTLEDILLESGRMPLARVLEIFMQVCDGLYCAHRNGLLHRDIKPGNILVTQTKDNKLLAKILDFGLVKRTKADRDTQSLTDVGDVFGSPNYMSPEQCRDEKLDERSDMYSLGCTIFECLAGRPPFFSNVPAAIFFSHMEGTPPTLASVVGEDIFPPALEAAIAKLLSKNPDDRYQSLMDLRHDLQTILEGETVPAPKAFIAPRPTRVQSRKSPWGTVAASLAVIVSVAVAAGFLYQYKLKPTGEDAGGAAAIPSITTATITSATTPPSKNAVETTATLTESAPAMAKVAALPTGKDVSIKDQTIKDQAKNDPVLNFPQHQIVTASLLLNKPFSTTVQEHGKWFRQFDFPKDVAIGLLAVPDKGKPFQAIGQIKLPVNDALVFIPAEIVGRCPDCLKRFQPHELVGIKFPPDADAKMFKAVGNIRGVVVLDFEMCKGITAEAVEPLRTLYNVWVLKGSDNNQECLMLAYNGCLEELKELYLTSSNSLVPLFTELAPKGKLNKLGVWARLTKQDIQAMAAVKSLNVLDVNNTTVDNEDMSVLSSLSNLSDLNVRQTKVDAGAIEALKKMPALKNLQINSPKLKAGDFEKIKTALPAVNVN